MGRKASTGKYVVPEEIRALKPPGVLCNIKPIGGHYYVYEHLRVDDPNHPGRKKNASGKCLGKIEGGRFVSNTEERKDIDRYDIATKEYGQYAAVLENSLGVYEKLDNIFSTEDATRIYVLGIIYFVEGYVPASYVKDYFDQCVLSEKWPTLSISENIVNTFLDSMGRHSQVLEKFQQQLIDESSGYTALDGHVILSCSKENDLADYGNKYTKLGNTQLNIMMAYDVEYNRPLTSRAFEGALPDKAAVSDWFDTYHFKEGTTFIVDMGFYSEDNLGLYRKNGAGFVTPVPDNTVIARTMKSSMIFTGSFQYDKTDENGKPTSDCVLYRESTVADLEDIAQKREDEKAEEDYQLRLAEYEKAPEGKRKPRRHKPKKVSRSKYPDDKITMYRNATMHDKLAIEFASQIGQDEKHTEEIYRELEPQFGTIILRNNLAGGPSDHYCIYKKRWRIETHYQHIRNGADFNGLQTDDYYSMQGLSFLMLIEGLIYRCYANKLQSASDSYVSRMSVKESLARASRVKITCHYDDNKWYVNKTTSGCGKLLEAMGVNCTKDMDKLNIHTY